MRAHCGKQMKRNQHEGISEIHTLKTLSFPFALVYLEAYLIFFGGAIDLVSTQHVSFLTLLAPVHVKAHETHEKINDPKR